MAITPEAVAGVTVNVVFSITGAPEATANATTVYEPCGAAITSVWPLVYWLTSGITSHATLVTLPPVTVRVAKLFSGMLVGPLIARAAGGVGAGGVGA
jgi:hypothetical protein